MMWAVNVMCQMEVTILSMSSRHRYIWWVFLIVENYCKQLAKLCYIFVSGWWAIRNSSRTYV